MDSDLGNRNFEGFLVGNCTEKSPTFHFFGALPGAHSKKSPAKIECSKVTWKHPHKNPLFVSLFLLLVLFQIFFLDMTHLSFIQFLSLVSCFFPVDVGSCALDLFQNYIPRTQMTLVLI